GNNSLSIWAGGEGSDGRAVIEIFFPFFGCDLQFPGLLPLGDPFLIVAGSEQSGGFVRGQIGHFSGARLAPQLCCTETSGGEQSSIGAELERLNEVEVGNTGLTVNTSGKQRWIGETAKLTLAGHVHEEDLIGSRGRSVLTIGVDCCGVDRIDSRRQWLPG